jgi:hypothetical protein
MIKIDDGYYFIAFEDEQKNLTNRYPCVLLPARKIQNKLTYNVEFRSPFNEINEHQLYSIINTNGYITEPALDYVNTNFNDYKKYSLWFQRLLYLISLEEKEVKSIMTLHRLSK